MATPFRVGRNHAPVMSQGGVLNEEGVVLHESGPGTRRLSAEFWAISGGRSGFSHREKGQPGPELKATLSYVPAGSPDALTWSLGKAQGRRDFHRTTVICAQITPDAFETRRRSGAL